jgi:peptide/nickel transport system permease protein
MGKAGIPYISDMLLYILKRVLYFIPTLLVISLLAFSISVYSPFDPAGGMDGGDFLGEGGRSNAVFDREARKQKLEKFNLQLPLFYFSLGSQAEPDTLYRIYERDARRMLVRLAHRYGNWEQVEAYARSIQELYYAHATLQADSASDIYAFRNLRLESLAKVSRLRYTYDPDRILILLDTLKVQYQGAPALTPLTGPLEKVRSGFMNLKKAATPWKRYLPRISFYGTQNQYHYWISGILTRFDFGKSYLNEQPVSDRLGERIFWSCALALLSIFFAFLISIPIGVLAAYFRGKWFDKLSGTALFMLYSLPGFFVATLLLIFFANPDKLNWFPSSFSSLLASQQSTGLAKQFLANLHRLVLPLVAYTYGSIAFLSRTVRASMLESLRQDFVRTARAKGLTEKRVLIRHALRNSLLPIITLLGSVFPAAIGGSVVMEYIFTIPGMGLETYRAVYDLDIPMILSIFTITGFLTVLGYLVSDILYAFADPRIRLGGKK